MFEISYFIRGLTRPTGPRPWLWPQTSGPRPEVSTLEANAKGKRQKSIKVT